MADGSPQQVVFLPVWQSRRSSHFLAGDLLQAESDETPLSCVANEGQDNRRADDHECEKDQESEIHFVLLINMTTALRPHRQN
jgi:UDP-N-acetylglucosamine transferase subunit ALG13